MKHLIILMVMTITSLSFNTVEDPLIVWRQGYKLRVEDFTQTLRELPNGATAISSIGIHMVQDTKRKAGFSAIAVFNKNQSYWSLNGQVWYKDIILHHEQIHFDIANYIACHLNKALDTIPQLQGKALENIHTKYVKEMNVMQDWYDNECKAKDSEQQKKCNRYIDSLIRSK